MNTELNTELKENLNNDHALRMEGWVEKYSKPLLDRAYYLLSNKEDAKDVVQEVFIAAHKNAVLFEGRSAPLTWLMGILNHKISDIYNKRYKENKSSLNFEACFNKYGEWVENDVADLWKQDENAIVKLLDNVHFYRIFNECINYLPRQWLAVVNKCYFQKQKANITCQELSLSPTNYWKVLQRSRLQLRKCLDTHWFKTEQ